MPKIDATKKRKKTPTRPLRTNTFVCESCGAKTSPFSVLPRASYCHVCSSLWEQAFMAAIAGLASTEEADRPVPMAQSAAAIADAAVSEVRTNIYRRKR
jgi:hypothetical protein